MKIYVVRHGQTNNNLENKMNGHNSQSLNGTGIKQAEIAREQLKNIELDLIICSPLKRTVETANIINVNNIPIVFNKNIMERDAGYLTNTSIENIDLDEWWNINSTKDYKDAESVKDLCTRINNFLNELKQKYSDKTVLLVTHGGVCKAIKAYFKGIPKDGNLKCFYQDNCEIVCYEL